MLDSSNPIVAAMRNIKSISLLLEANPHIADDYDINFFGEKQNVIFADDFYSVLHSRFKIDIDREEFYRLLPEICHLYKMNVDYGSDGLIQSITLW